MKGLGLVIVILIPYLIVHAFMWGVKHQDTLGRAEELFDLPLLLGLPVLFGCAFLFVVTAVGLAALFIAGLGLVFS